LDIDRALDHMFTQYGKCLRAKCETFDTNHGFIDWFLCRLHPDDASNSGETQMSAQSEEF